MTSPSQPPRPSSDALRAAMDQVRGVRSEPAAQPAQEAAIEAVVPKRRKFWDVRGRVSDDLARVPTPNAAAWPRPLAGLIAGAWAALMSWLVFAGVILVGWVFAPLGSGTFSDVMRASGAIWLVSNGGVLQWQLATISLVPLLATFLIVLFQRRAGAWMATAVDIVDARSARGPLGYAIASAASAQALMAATIRNATLDVPLWRSLLGAAIVAAVGFGWGIVRVVGLRVPDASRLPMRIALRFVVAMSAAALASLVVSAVVNRAAVSGVLGVVASDRTSVLQVLLLCVMYLPTVIGWAIAFLLGPGFSVGAGTAVSLGGVSMSALPPIPLLALIPESLPPLAPIALLIPALAAVWATRGSLHDRPIVTVGQTLAWVTAGAMLLANAVFGGIGPGRLTTVGPLWWTCTLAAIGWMAFGFAVHAAWSWLQLRMRKPGESAADDADKLAT